MPDQKDTNSISVLSRNLKEVRTSIESSCARAARDPSTVTLIAVVKNVESPVIAQLAQLGVTDFAENYVQTGQKKISEVKQIEPAAVLRWHFIGHLQTNKVKNALSLFSFIHSLDSVRLALEIDKVAKRSGITVPVFVEVKTSAEESKFGIAAEELPNILKEVASLGNIDVVGLMTMAPYLEDKENARPFFHRLRELKDEANSLRIAGINLRYLSMGMSNDFEVAVEEGATHLRIGTALFRGLK